jgi:hypothetical protein
VRARTTASPAAASFCKKAMCELERRTDHAAQAVDFLTDTTALPPFDCKTEERMKSVACPRWQVEKQYFTVFDLAQLGAGGTGGFVLLFCVDWACGDTSLSWSSSKQSGLACTTSAPHTQHFVRARRTGPLFPFTVPLHCHLGGRTLYTAGLDTISGRVDGQLYTKPGDGRTLWMAHADRPSRETRLVAVSL